MTGPDTAKPVTSSYPGGDRVYSVYCLRNLSREFAVNATLSGACLVFFLLLPPVLLALRLFRARPAWWSIGVMVVVFGWLSWFGAYFFYQQHISQLIAQGAELPEGWDGDGAAGMFALYMGWLVSLFYLLPWLVVYISANLLRRFVRRSSAPDPDDDPA